MEWDNVRETFLVATVGDSILWLLFHNGRDWKNDILKIPKFNKQLLYYYYVLRKQKQIYNNKIGKKLLQSRERFFIHIIKIDSWEIFFFIFVFFVSSSASYFFPFQCLTMRCFLLPRKLSLSLLVSATYDHSLFGDHMTWIFCDFSI